MSLSKLSFAASVLALSLSLAHPGLTAGGSQQEKPKEEKPQGMGGVSTGAAKTYTSRRTSGISDPNAPVVFEDITGQTALASFKHRAGTPTKEYIIEATGGGAAIFDYDGDGRPDIYLLNGSTFA